MINGDYISSAQVAAFVPEDEEAYQLWLRNPSARCDHIIHLGYHGTSADYPDYDPFTVKLSDFPIAGYRDVIKAIPSLTRQISDDLAGEVTASIGELVLDNADGGLDLWHNLALDGQPVRIYHGDRAWGVDRFRLLIECVADIVTSSNQDTLSIRLRGLEHGANVPIQTNLIPASVGATAPSNTPIPLAYGNVFNVKPAEIDEANSTYQWNDGAVTSVTEARDDGYPFRTNQIAIATANLGSPPSNLLSFASAHGFFKDTRVRCDVGTLPTSSTWIGIAWNGAVFCTVAYLTAICATSPDGITWTQHAMPSSAGWYGIAWNGTVFCVVGNGSAICATSPDGITWTQRAMPSSAGWNGIAWNGTVFCAVAPGTKAATSPDGINWTAQTLPTSTNWGAIAWNGTVFCAITGSNATAAATSPDGAIWTAQTLPATAFWTNIAWNGSVFCAIAMNSTAAATSPDGATWTLQTLPSAVPQWNGIAWNGTTFCVVAMNSASACTSPDGVTWTAQTLPVSAAWSAVAWNGYVFCTVGGGTSYVSISADGVTWSGINNTLPAPLAINTDYWVCADGYTTTACKLSATRGGDPITLTGTDTGALLVGFHWTADLTTGKIYCDSRPSGVLTLDGTAGSTAAATIMPTVLNVVNVDADSQSAFAVTCAQPIGIYVAERRNRLDVARDIMSGLGAWYGYNRYSMFKMGRIEGSYTAHDFEVTEDEMDDGSFVIERMIPPAKLHRIGYRKNWTNQTGALVAGVSAEMRGLFSSDYSTSAPTLGDDEGPAGEEFHLLARKPDAIESMMTHGSDALAEALRRDGMFYGWGAIFRCTVGRVGAEMDPGHVVKVTHSRYNCAAGVRMALVYVEDRPTDRATVLKFFATLAAYTPGQL